MLTVTLTRGLPGSGKDTWAEEMMKQSPGQYRRINKDMLRNMLDDGRWSGHNEDFILDTRDQLILAALNDGKHVLVTDTNLHPRHEIRIRQLVKGIAEVKIQDFTNVPIEVCIERDLKRSNSVGEKIIRQMNQYLTSPILKIEPNDSLPWTILSDVDGTLAIRGDRDIYEFEKAGEDQPNKLLIHIIGELTKMRYLTCVTGREEKYRDITEHWLKRYGVPYRNLYMRKTGDDRKDNIVKKEIYEEHIKDKYNVLAVFDDRISVCRLWHSLGLPLYRVGDPDAAF